jgi:hypothetical protein
LDAANRAGAAAGRARLLGAKGLGLLLEQGGEGALGQPGGGSAGDLLHGGQIDFGPRAVAAEGVAGDDLAPAGGQRTDFQEVLGREMATRHDEPCLGVARPNGNGFLPPLYCQALCQAKLFMASGGGL